MPDKEIDLWDSISVFSVSRKYVNSVTSRVIMILRQRLQPNSRPILEK